MFWAGVPCGSTFQGTTATRPSGGQPGKQPPACCARPGAALETTSSLARLSSLLCSALDGPLVPQCWRQLRSPSNAGDRVVQSATSFAGGGLDRGRQPNMLPDDRRAVGSKKACNVASYCVPGDQMFPIEFRRIAWRASEVSVSPVSFPGTSRFCQAATSLSTELRRSQ